jgi:hypothetical protein
MTYEFRPLPQSSVYVRDMSFCRLEKQLYSIRMNTPRAWLSKRYGDI